MDLTLVLVIFLIVGAVFMFGIMLLCRRQYGITVWKTAALSIFSVLSGVIGVKLMYFIENGTLAGLSFYGGVFFCPLLLILFAKLFKVRYPDVLDLFAPAICMISAVMKVQCLMTGCCQGKILEILPDDTVIRFPSRETEMALAVVIMIVLIILIKNKKCLGKIYPLFMIFYGVGRFILNLYRDTEPGIFDIPVGNVWSIVSVILGIAAIIVINVIKKKRTSSPE